ncbi:MAG: purine-nucleoside phosphorylase [Oscillospiraceae bacterium]|nr:purine-nucleoside phosphorylase [Oscillospiraceae bacterium]
MATPHIAAEKGMIAKTVLMPGDPLRSAFVAKNFLEDAMLVNNTRGVQGYTGSYQGKKVTVMASGMGMPSIGIYAHELYASYDVEQIIRIGTAGGLQEDLNLRDVLLGQAACTDSAFVTQYELPGSFSPIADFDLLMQAKKEAEKLGIPVRVGNLLSSDRFYDAGERLKDWKEMGVLGVEMEAAALYCKAAEFGKKALAICTVSDLPLKGEFTSAEERERSFTDMMKLALSLA